MAWSIQLISVFLLAVTSALPADPVISKLNPERYQYVWDGNGTPHLVDMWSKASDVQEAARYAADTQNQYHLFTRSNPSISQPLVVGNEGILTSSNFSPDRRTIIMVHGWMNSATSEIFTVLVPSYLAGEDVNVIVVDWSAGSGTINYFAAVENTVTSGISVANFITWLNAASGASISDYHLIGHSLGGHQVGIIGRQLGGEVPYITALDPALPGWVTNDNRFQSTDGVYTEVIHTNAGNLGYLTTLGDVDFYPNGGTDMPGCSSIDCNHGRSFFYMAESLESGGFLGRECLSYITAMTGNCVMLGRLRMGGLSPKTGSTGIYYLETNAAPPFSMD